MTPHGLTSPYKTLKPGGNSQAKREKAMKEIWRKKAVFMALIISNVVVSMGVGVGVGSSALPQFPTTPNSMSFQECYAGCFILCAIQPTRTLSSCGFECLVDCLMPQNLNNNNNNNNNKSDSHKMLSTPFHLCNLGCACVHCTNISTLNNPGAKEVAVCVGSCSGVCRTNYMP